MWFDELFSPRRTGDVVGAFSRSLPLAVMVMLLTVLISVTAGFAFRRRFKGSTAHLLHGDRQPHRPRAGAVDRHAGDFRYLGLSAAWYSSALGAHLSWSLPFGLLIMFAVLGRLNPSYEEAGLRSRRQPLADRARTSSSRSSFPA